MGLIGGWLVDLDLEAMVMGHAPKKCEERQGNSEQSVRVDEMKAREYVTWTVDVSGR